MAGQEAAGEVEAVAAQNIAERGSRQAFDRVEAVEECVRRTRQRRRPEDAHQHVGFDADGFVAVGCPVEAQHAFGTVDPCAGNHDIVAGFGVGIIVAAAAVDDVVADDGTDLERIAVVALQQVVAAAAFDPVVAFAGEHDIGIDAVQNEVVATAAERFLGVWTGDDEVHAVATQNEVAHARATADDVIAVTAFVIVDAERVSDDVVAGAADEEVVAGAAFEPVVAAIAVQRVVAQACDQGIVGRRAAENDVVRAGESEEVGVDAGRVWIVTDHQGLE